MKIAVTGKGGVGKTLLSALLIREYARKGFSVLAIDADPDTNLASTLGFPHPETIIPISEIKELVEERTGSKQDQPGTLFKLNPRVDDIPEKYARRLDGIRLMVMGRLKRGGSGCYCRENTLLQALITHLLLIRNEVVILDMAAGIEHLSRATARAVDKLIIVVEPSRKSLETGLIIKQLASDIGIKNLAVVGNKIRNQTDRDFLISNLPGFDFLGFIPFDPAIINAEVSGISPLESSRPVLSEIESIFLKLEPAKN
jgi:CO dehydrogenase maturation factor